MKGWLNNSGNQGTTIWELLIFCEPGAGAVIGLLLQVYPELIKGSFQGSVILFNFNKRGIFQKTPVVLIVRGQ